MEKLRRLIVPAVAFVLIAVVVIFFVHGNQPGASEKVADGIHYLKTLEEGDVQAVEDILASQRQAKQQAEKEKVDIRLYRVIYQAIEEINAARVGLLSPDIVEEDTGIAEVRELFKVPKVGTIAGCYMLEGEMHRDDKVRLVRNGTVIYDGSLASMRRFKDDVKSVKSGYECGLGVEGFQDLKIGDTIEGYIVKEVERTE